MTDEDPNRVFSVQPVPKTIQERAIDMAFGQGFGTVLCCVVIYFLWTGMQQQIPAHLKTITDGYQSIAEQDRAARKADATTYAETMKLATETFKQEQERTERILTNRVKAVETKIDSMNN
jgi:hypothetical protein